jgi:ABC-type branched-subunit amino acid transport system substrate-binding protein
LNGVELALSQISYGETAPAIKIVVMDTASQNFRAVKGVKKLAAARVAAIIGPIVTSSAAAQEAQRLGIPMVTFTQKPDIATIGDCIFRHFITPQTQVDTLSDYLFEDLGLRHFAIMYPRETYGQTFMELFWDALIRRQATLTGVEAYDPQLTDFADTIKKLVGTYYPIPKDLRNPPLIWVADSPYLDHRMETTGVLEEIFPDPLIRLSGLYGQDSVRHGSKGSDAGTRAGEDEQLQPRVDFDALFIPDAPNKVGLILPQLAFYDVKDIYLVGTNLWHSEQLIEMTKEFAQNALMVDGFFKDSQSTTVQAFVQDYKALYRKDPGVIEAFAYDTAHVIFSLLNRPDLRSLTDMRFALQQSLTLQGATGPLYFADTGEAIKRLSLLRIKDGRFFEIDRQ